MKRRYQLIVVGAGPAGSYAAATAAKAGCEVLLVERDREVGYPLACAEGVSAEGLRRFVEPNESFIAAEIDTIHLNVATGYSYTYEFGQPSGYILNRPAFDQYLAGEAVAAGAELRIGTRATGIEIKNGEPAKIYLESPTGTEIVRGDYVIAADGVESMMGRLAGINTHLKLAEAEATLQYRVSGIDIDPCCAEFYFGAKYTPNGYLWVFPKSSHSANIGVGLNPAKSEGSYLRELLDRFVREHYRRSKIEFAVCGLVPKFVGLQLLGRGNLLLAGDAARTVDSVAGAGISKALHTGQITGRAVVAALREKMTDKELQKHYRHVVSSEIGSELRFLRMVYPVFRKFDDKDWESLIRFLKRLSEKEKTGLIPDPVAIVRKAMASIPCLTRLARHCI